MSPSRAYDDGQDRSSRSGSSFRRERGSRYRHTPSRHSQSSSSAFPQHDSDSGDGEDPSSRQDPQYTHPAYVTPADVVEYAPVPRAWENDNQSISRVSNNTALYAQVAPPGTFPQYPNHPHNSTYHISPPHPSHASYQRPTHHPSTITASTSHHNHTHPQRLSPANLAIFDHQTHPTSTLHRYTHQPQRFGPFDAVDYIRQDRQVHNRISEAHPYPEDPHNNEYEEEDSFYEHNWQHSSSP